MTVSIKVGAELDAAQINQQLAELTRRINGTGQAIAQAGRLRFEPISRATLDMAQRVEQTMRNIQRISPELHRRLGATGQSGAAFDRIDWSRLYGNPAQRVRAQRNLFQMATGLGFGDLPSPMPGPARPGGGMVPSPGGGGLPGLPSILPNLLPHFGTPGRIGLNAYNAGMRHYTAAGGGARGLGAGMVGGIGAGLGFAAVQGIGALISGVREHIGIAQQEGIGYADLYRRMGGRGAGNRFNALRYQMRGVSDEIGVGYDEVLGLSNLAARRGNLTSSGDLAGMVGLGGGFARSFGFEPGAGVAAFAGLRGVGATRSVDDTRRLGLAIAEGIARAGVFAKAEEYLAEIVSFGENSARSDLSRPNMEAFNEALAGLVGARIPGLDVRGAAALLNTADASIRRGGAAGEAGQAFLYQAIGRRLGLDPIQVGHMQEGGLFATGRNTFGDPNSVVRRHYQRYGLAIPERAANDERTIFELYHEGLRAQYTGGNRRLLAEAAANGLGLSQRQAMAFLDLDPEQIRGISRLGLSDDQLRGADATAFQTLGRLGVANRDQMTDIGRELLSRTGDRRISGEDRDRLTAVLRPGEDDATLRQALAELTAKYGAEETEGDKTRRTLQGIDKTLTDMATRLVEPLNTARDALLVIAGRNGGPNTARGVANAVRDAEVSEADNTRTAALATLAQQESVAGDRYARAMGLAANNPDDAVLARRADEARAEVERLAGERQRIEAEHTAAVAAANQRRDLTLGIGAGRSPPVSGSVQERADAFADLVQARGGGAITENMALGFAANAIGESAAGANQVGGDSGRSSGYLQWNGERRENFRRMFGRDPHEATPDEQARFAAWELTSGDSRNTERGTLARMREWIARQPGGATPENWTEAITRFYERSADPDRDAAIRRGYATTLSQGRRARAGAAPAPAARAAPAAAAAAPDLPDALAPPRTLEEARLRSAGLGIPEPMPAGAAPDAVQNAPGGTPTVRLEAAPLYGTVTVQSADGVPMAPPTQMQTTIRPAQASGANSRSFLRDFVR